MDHKAALLALVLVSSSLAGCTGDPGEGGGDEFDSEALQDLIDENLQDFMNNTSITVNNHFYNNTTVVNNDYDTNNDYNNTTNVDGGEINNYNQYNGSGAGSASIMQMFTVGWSLEDAIGYDPGDRMLVTDYAQNGSSGNGSGSGGDNTLLFARSYNGYVVEFRLTCEEFFNYYYLYDEADWREHLADNYGYNSNEIYNTADWIDDWFSSSRSGNGIDAYEQCNYNDWVEEDRVILYEIDLEVGQAMNFLVNGPYVTVDINCDDGYGTGLGNGTSTVYIGGQTNCTITGSTTVLWEFQSLGAMRDGDGNLVVIDGYTWQEYGANPYPYMAPENFAVYFMMHYVEVYDLDSE